MNSIVELATELGWSSGSLSASEFIRTYIINNIGNDNIIIAVNDNIIIIYNNNVQRRIELKKIDKDGFIKLVESPPVF